MLGKIGVNNKKYVGVISMVILWLFCCFVSSSIYRNITKSEPLGYYLAYRPFSYNVGDFVLLCVDNQKYVDIMHKLGAERISGECKNSTAYLIKRIIAGSGDTVIINHDGITVNGMHYLDSKAIESHNRVYLLPQKDQQIRLKHAEFFVLGDSKTSFDSRYFGIVHSWEIAKKAILLYETCSKSSN